MGSSACDMGGLRKAILQGNGELSIEELNKVLAYATPEEILSEGVLKAWKDFAEWYERDPMGSLKSWLDCYNATYKILKALDSAIASPSNPPFSVLVINVRGENHVLTKDIIALLIKTRGIMAHSVKRGVVYEDISGFIADHSLKFVIISNTQSDTVEAASHLVRQIRMVRPEIKIIAGGATSSLIGADIVLNEPLEICRAIMPRGT